jgi:hypothetical protein
MDKKLDREAFKAWLESCGDGKAWVGGVGHACPIANYLYASRPPWVGNNKVHVGSAAVNVNGQSHELPIWAQRFVLAFDLRADRYRQADGIYSVNAREALSILTGIPQDLGVKCFNKP